MQVAPLPRRPASSLGLGGAQRAQHGDDQPAVGPLPDPLDQGRHVAPLGQPDLGEMVQQQPVAAALRRVDVDPGIGDQPQLVAGLPQVHGDAGGGRDRPLEAGGRPLAAVRRTPGCPAPPSPGSPTAAPRGAPSARRCGRSTASAPGAGRRRAGTPGSPRRPRRAPPPTGPGCRRCRRTRRRAGPCGSGADLRDDGEPVDAGERPGQLAQPERVGQPDDQRADLVPAAHVGAHRVRHRAGLVRAEPFQHHPGPAAQRVRQPVLQQQRAGRQPGHVLQPQHHPGAGADRHPVRVQRRGCRPACTGCGRRRPRPAAAGPRAARPPAAGPSRRGSARRCAAASAAARKERPRVVRPRSASRTVTASAARTGIGRCRPAGAGPGVVRRALLPVVRHRQPVHQVGDDRVGGAPGELRVGRRDDPVGEHRHGEGLQVVGEDVVAAVQRGDRAGGAQQLQGGPGRGAEAQVGGLAGGGDQVDGVLLDRVGDVDVADRGDQPADGRGVGDRLQRRRSGSCGRRARRAWPARRRRPGSPSRSGR